MPKTYTQNPRKGNSSDNVHRPTNGKGGMRSKSTIMRLNMYKRGNPVRNKEGEIIGGTLMMGDKSGGKDMARVARIAPDRRWFGNTRTISPNDLDRFREEMTLKEADPNSIILRRQKIPMALLKDSEKVAKMNLLETETYDEVFGGKQKRKRPKMDGNTCDYSSLMISASERISEYEKNPSKDSNIEITASGELDIRKDDLFSKGQSKRIWGELYKVLDCSDVVLQIVDARNVPGTRSKHIEHYLKKNAAHKQLIIVINKCDLVPGWVTRKWVKLLSAEYPTLAYHASLTNSFGKGALISLLRQFGKLHADKRQISVGVIGYPNCGKSSVINSLMGKKCCKVAPIPGETKVWQYIALMKRIFLIDCPGVVYDTGDDEVETVLKGVVRAERLETPTDFIPAILDRVKPEYLIRQYLINNWTDPLDFLSKLAFRSGKLLKGGEPDVAQVAVHIINDWQRGKLPYFVAPPRLHGDGETEIDLLDNSTAADQLEDNDDDEDEDDDGDEEDDDQDNKMVGNKNLKGLDALNRTMLTKRKYLDTDDLNDADEGDEDDAGDEFTYQVPEVLKSSTATATATAATTTAATATATAKTTKTTASSSTAKKTSSNNNNDADDDDGDEEDDNISEGYVFEEFDEINDDKESKEQATQHKTNGGTRKGVSQVSSKVSSKAPRLSKQKSTATGAASAGWDEI